MSLSDMSVSLCVYMRGGEGLDGGQSCHVQTSPAEALTNTESERTMCRSTDWV